MQKFNKKNLIVAIACYMEERGDSDADAEKMRDHIKGNSMSLSDIGDYLFHAFGMGYSTVIDAINDEEHCLHIPVPDWAIQRMDEFHEDLPYD